ncbi:hypothetical protein EK904_003058, partial [Melospiza melodia maxima]
MGQHMPYKKADTQTEQTRSETTWQEQTVGQVLLQHTEPGFRPKPTKNSRSIPSCCNGLQNPKRSPSVCTKPHHLDPADTVGFSSQVSSLHTAPPSRHNPTSTRNDPGMKILIISLQRCFRETMQPQLGLRFRSTGGGSHSAAGTDRLGGVFGLDLKP